jgi:hypothetical protein
MVEFKKPKKYKSPFRKRALSIVMVHERNEFHQREYFHT